MSTNPRHKLCVQFSPFTFAFLTESRSVHAILERFFAGYQQDHTPDITVEIHLSDSMPDPLMQMGAFQTPAVSEDNRTFNLGPDIIKGTFDKEDNSCGIIIHPDFFKLPTVNIFQYFLYLLYYTVCLIKNQKSFFIHACGLVKNDTAYLFTGPHQSGKTTIGALSKGLVLHDDQVIVHLENGHARMSSPPLPAKIRSGWHDSCKIDKIFLIKQNEDISVKPVQMKECLAGLYREIVSPLTLHSIDENTARKNKGELCFDIANHLPIYELNFDKDGRFWKYI